jgi:hypothetical protein
MNRATLANIGVLALGIFTSSCAGESTLYPSLAIRDVERVQGSAPPTEGELPPPPPETPSPDLSQRLQQLRNDANQAHRDFMNAAPGAERQVNAAGKAAVASDAWVSAQVAIANLEVSRSKLLIALADLDSLHVAAELNGGARTIISETRDQVDQLSQTENDIISRLLASLSS